tara:strand:- start:489 stop:743 length:255 start_codon:yes stop_codon:yes gene_type:complete
VSDNASTRPLRYWVESSVEQYFQALDGSEPSQIYAMVLKEVHTGLLRSVLRATNGNQSKAATFLGISRGTLRKIMAEQMIEEFE